MSRLLQSLRESFGLLDRDVLQAKREFGRVLYDHVDALYARDKDAFLSVGTLTGSPRIEDDITDEDRDVLIVTVRPTFLATQMEVAALRTKIDRIERDLSDHTSTVTTSTSTSMTSENVVTKRLKKAALQTARHGYLRRIEQLKGDFGVALYDTFVQVENEDNEIVEYGNTDQDSVDGDHTANRDVKGSAPTTRTKRSLLEIDPVLQQAFVTCHEQVSCLLQRKIVSQNKGHNHLSDHKQDGDDNCSDEARGTHPGRHDETDCGPPMEILCDTAHARMDVTAHAVVQRGTDEDGDSDRVHENVETSSCSSETSFVGEDEEEYHLQDSTLHNCLPLGLTEHKSQDNLQHNQHLPETAPAPQAAVVDIKAKEDEEGCGDNDDDDSVFAIDKDETPNDVSQQNGLREEEATATVDATHDWEHTKDVSGMDGMQKSKPDTSVLEGSTQTAAGTESSHHPSSGPTRRLINPPAASVEIELRKAETIKNEYTWETPEWVGRAPALTSKISLADVEKPKEIVRSEPLERVALRKAEPVKNTYEWEKPEWTKAVVLKSTKKCT